MAKHINTGGLWINKYKTNAYGDTKPHWTGDINIEGITYKLAGWSNPGDGGRPVIALTVQAIAPPAPAKAVAFDPLNPPDDTIPF